MNDEKKKIHSTDFLIAGVMLLTCILVFALAYGRSFQKKINTPAQYETTVFDKSRVLDINIQMPPAEWDSLLKHAIKEEYSKCNVTINGITYQNVGIRAKGNSTLVNVVWDENSDRYNFLLKFDAFLKGQTLDGLDEICLNGFYSDNSCIKEYVAYDMFSYMKVKAPLCSYAAIHVNDSYWGLYLAIESLNRSFLQRSYGTQKGMLYKPEALESTSPFRSLKGVDFGVLKENMTNLKSEDQEQQFVEMFIALDDALNGKGSDLIYRGDKLSRYKVIWESAKTAKPVRSDKKRVVNALKHINKGEQVQDYLDVDQMQRFIAVNQILQNTDNYFAYLCHNYYLYENNGKLAMLPWDYEMSCGGSDRIDPKKLVNLPIDDMMFMGDIKKRPLLSSAVSSSQDYAIYHQYLREIIQGYFKSGKFDETISNVCDLIEPYIKKDPTIAHSFAEYEKGQHTAVQVLKRRVESVEKQLDGILPAKGADRTGNEKELVDCSDIDMHNMGSDNMGGLLKQMGFGDLSENTSKKSIAVHFIMGIVRKIGIVLLSILGASFGLRWIKRYRRR